MRNFNIAAQAPDWMTLIRRARPLLVLLSLSLACQAQAQSRGVDLQESAPERYTVEKGDTLWSIANKFLKEPFRWPEIWRLNQEQIKNPNRIFPGDVLVLDRSKTPPQLSVLDTVKLSPGVKTEALPREAIAAIPAKIIEPFLTQPLVIDAGGLENAPRIVATEENRVHLGAGGVAYVSGIGANSSAEWQIYRPGKALIDPDTKAVLGYEAIFLGIGIVRRDGEPATLAIKSATQEISSGDRLIAMPLPTLNQYVPHAPSTFVRGRIIGMYNGLSTSESGRYSVVSVNKGKRDGMEAGHVLAVMRAGTTVADPKSEKSRDSAPTFKLPDERYGLLFVFRVFDAVSYALVMESTRPVEPADIIQTP